MGYKLLVIDDDPGIVRLITKALEAEGHEVDSASDGIPALELAKKKDYTLIITDITLPKMSGLDFFKSLKKEKPDTPIILISGNTEFNYALEGLNLGAVAFLVKPFDNSELLKWVNRIIQTHEKLHAREHLFENFSSETHQMELLTSTLMEEDNLFLLATLMAERFRVCTPTNKIGKLKLELAIHEALRNSGEHGNLELDSSLKPDPFAFGEEDPYEELMKERLGDPKYAQRKVCLEFSRRNGKVALKIRDEGEGFAHKAFTESKDENELCHGRGLLIINAGLDEVSFNDKGNEITLTNNIPC